MRGMQSYRLEPSPQAASEWAGEAVGRPEMHLSLLLSNPITLLLSSSFLAEKLLRTFQGK